MSENNQKIVTDAIFESAIEKILTEISDYIYVEEPYTKPEIDAMFDATSQEIDYYSSLISDVVSENRLWSSKKISEEIAKSILESNEYSDNLISNLSSINLKYVESLPDTGDSSTIYILKSASEADPDTLNLFDGTQWVTIGNFEIDMANYVTTDDMNTELGKKANDNEVVKVSNILTDTTGASNNNVLSASATVTELDKKVNKTDIVDNLTSTDIDKPLSAKQGKALDDKKLNKADADKIIIINAEGVNIKDFILENCTDENKTYYITARSSCTDIPKVNANYFMTVEKVGSFTIKVTAKELAGNNNEYVCTYRIDTVKWTDWEKVLSSSDIVTTINNTSTNDKVPSASAIYNKSKNRISQVRTDGDILAYADSIIGEEVSDTVRIMNGKNSPYGADDIDNDFHYVIYNIADVRFRRIVAYDIRKNDMYMIMKNGGKWGTWQRVCTTKIKDIGITYINTFEDETYVKPTGTNSCSYHVTNGHCIVTLQTLCLSTTNSFIQIVSGLPKPKTFLYANIIDRNMTSNSGARGVFQITTSGAINVVCNYGDTSVTAGRNLYATFSYPVKES